MNRKFILIGVCSFLFAGVSTYMIGQVVVTDPTAQATAVEQLAITSESLTQSKQQYSMLKESMEKMKKVNRRIDELDMLETALRNQAYTLQYSTKYFNELKSSGQFNASELSLILGNFNNIITSSSRSVKLARMVLTDNSLEMNDVERLEVLDKTSKEIVGCRMATDNLNARYRRLAYKRSIYKMMGKR